MFFKSIDGVTWTEYNDCTEEVMNGIEHYTTSTTPFKLNNGTLLPTHEKSVFIHNDGESFFYIKWTNDTKKKTVDFIRSRIEYNVPIIEEDEELNKDTDNVFDTNNVDLSKNTSHCSSPHNPVSTPIHSPSLNDLDQQILNSKISMLVQIQENVHETI